MVTGILGGVSVDGKEQTIWKTYSLEFKSLFVKRSDYRGGASEASVATLTGDVDGSSRYMYDTCVKPLGQLLHAHAQMVLSQQILKFILTLEKKISCSGVGSNLGLMHCRPLLLPPSQWGSGSSGLQIWLLYC